MEKALFWIAGIMFAIYLYSPTALIVIGVVFLVIVFIVYVVAESQKYDEQQKEAEAKRNEEIEKAAKEAERQKAEELALIAAKEAQERKSREIEVARKQSIEAEENRLRKIEEQRKIIERYNAEMRVAQKHYIVEKCQPYIAALAKKRQRLITSDDYGDPDYRAWFNEISDFYNKKIVGIPSSMQFQKLPDEFSFNAFISEKEIRYVIDLLAQEGQKELLADDDIVDDMNGIDFEHYCSDKLRAAGWKTTVSTASGDQGADIIAEYDDIKVAIQCKRFSKPVGNKAVQEVAAARNYYGSDFAVVVTNNTFTKSAKQLANTNDVHLIHYSDLGELASILEIA